MTSTVKVARSIDLMVRSQWILTPSASASAASNSIDDHGLRRAEPARHPRRVHGGVAAAVDRDATELRRLVGLDRAQERHGVQHLASIARGDLGPLAEVRADRDEAGVEAAVPHLRLDILDLVIRGDPDAQLLDLTDLGLEQGARHAVGGNAEVHHAARDRAGIADLDLVPEAGEVVAGGDARGPGAHHQHPLARALRRTLEAPAVLDRGIAEEALDGVDADRAVELRAVAAVLAGMVADPAVHRRQRVVGGEDPPRLLEAPALRRAEPGLDVLAGGAGVIARRQEVDVDRPLRPERPGPPLVREVRRAGEVGRALAHPGLPALP